MTSAGSPLPSVSLAEGLRRRNAPRPDGAYRRMLPSGCYYPLWTGNRWQYASENVLTVESGTA